MNYTSLARAASHRANIASKLASCLRYSEPPVRYSCTSTLCLRMHKLQMPCSACTDTWMWLDTYKLHRQCVCSLYKIHHYDVFTCSWLCRGNEGNEAIRLFTSSTRTMLLESVNVHIVVTPSKLASCLGYSELAHGLRRLYCDR